MLVRLVKRYEIEKTVEIDRSEIIDDIYYYRNGRLILEKEHYDISGWHPDELQKNLLRLYEIFDRGGTIYGAFDDSKMIAIMALDGKFIGTIKDRLQLYFMYVSKVFRKGGIGKKLFDIAVEKAREAGARGLYISATPSKNTVDFYLRLGCRPASELDEELYKLEPQDIHLEFRI